MKTFTIDSENNITVHASRKAARETGLGAFASEEQFADLIGPDNKRLVEIWNSLPGVKPVTKFANRKSATERIWKALQSLGEAAAAPVPETPFDAPEAGAAPAKLPVAEPEPVKDSRPLEDATLQTEIEPIALTAPAAGERAEPAANAGAQEPQGNRLNRCCDVCEDPFVRLTERGLPVTLIRPVIHASAVADLEPFASMAILKRILLRQGDAVRDGRVQSCALGRKKAVDEILNH